MSRCKVWTDLQGIFVREDNKAIRPRIPETHRHFNAPGYRELIEGDTGRKIVTEETTRIRYGDYVKKYHSGGTPMYYITKDGDPTIREIWFIQD